ncbi:tyrosine-protein phosphatase [Brevibacterium samyangense]|uniref:Uncharacterized protein n=1 Tax=Brevibacterium samyangense TaxID=366888 RepID=A0ABN2TNG0_9MICO
MTTQTRTRPTPVPQTLAPADRSRMEQAFRVPRARFLVSGVLAAGILVWSANGAGFDFAKLANGSVNMLEFVTRMFPPDFSKIGPVLQLLLETLQMAAVGSVLGAACSLLVAFGAASTIAPPWLYCTCRWIMNIIRSLPDLVIALVFTLAGAAREDVVRDYTVTDGNMDGVHARMGTSAHVTMARFAAQGIDMSRMMGAKAPDIEALLDALEAHPGGPEGWFTTHGGTPETLRDLRDRLCEATVD